MGSATLPRAHYMASTPGGCVITFAKLPSTTVRQGIANALLQIHGVTAAEWQATNLALRFDEHWPAYQVLRRVNERVHPYLLTLAALTAQNTESDTSRWVFTCELQFPIAPQDIARRANGIGILDLHLGEFGLTRMVLMQRGQSLEAALQNLYKQFSLYVPRSAQ